MRMYHYTSTANWQRMNDDNPSENFLNPQTGRIVSGSAGRGLWPRRPLVPPPISGLPAEAYVAWSFGLEEEQPKKWTENSRFPNVWHNLLNYAAHGDGSLTLLEVTLLADDQPQVIDWAHIEQLPTHLALTVAEQHAYHRYWESRIALPCYDGSHDLPEIIVQKPIPLERIKKVWDRRLSGKIVW